MPDCPELSPHSGPLPAEERKPGRMEVGAGEMSVGFSEPALEAQHPVSCPSPTRGAVCLLPAFGAPSAMGAVLSQGFCLSLFMFLSMSPTVREPYQNEVSLKSGAEIIISLLGQSCLNQAGNEER